MRILATMTALLLQAGGFAQQLGVPVAAPRMNRPLTELIDLEHLPQIKRGVRCYQTSSFDRPGLNDDGLSGLFSFLRIDPLGHYVLFDQDGPGAINRMHFAFLDTVVPAGGMDDYTLFFYLDHESVPRLSIPVKQLVAGTTPPFLFPLAMDDVVSPGGPLISYPIEFRDHLLITADRPVHYIDWQYHLYTDAGDVESFDPARATKPPQVDDMIARLPSDPKGVDPGEIRQGSNTLLLAGQSAQVFSYRGAGVIRALHFDFVQPLSRDELQNLWIRASFDSATAPQIEAPFGLFFGDEQSEKDLHCLFFGHDSALGYYCYFPMPFDQQVTIELVNNTAGNLVSLHEVAYTPVPFAGDYGYFHAQFNEQDPTRFLEHYVILNRQGHGHFVGCAMTVGSDGYQGQRQLLTYLEGDERIFIDDSRTPQLHGTGTEEFFNWGWYEFPHATEFDLPWHGHPTRWVQGIRDYTSLYRTMHADYIPFYRSISVELEVGPLGEVPAHYRSVAFFYARDSVALTLTDTIDVGDPASEAAHAYNPASTSIVLPTLNAFYEGGWQQIGAVDEGREEDRPHSFAISLDPANVGALLRRRLDNRFHAQEAEVFVDGRSAGRWGSPRTNPWRGWLDAEFAIAPELVRGKSRATISIRPLAPGWNAYCYKVYSYL